MYKFLLGALLGVPCVLLAQQGGGDFSIQGKVTGFREKLIYFVYAKNDTRIIDSCEVRNGMYHFQGVVEHNTMAVVADTPLRGPIYPRNGVQFYLMPGALTLDHIDSFSNATALGSAANTDLFALQAGVKEGFRPMRAMHGAYDSATKAGDAALAKKMDDRMDSLSNSVMEKTYGDYVRQHPASPIALYALQVYSGGMLDPAKVQPMFAALSEELRNSPDGKKFADKIAKADQFSIGKPAVDFTQNDTSGRPVSLFAFRGKYVLLDFWASWCVPCRNENPNVVKAYQKYHPRGLEIVSVSLDKEADKAKWLQAIHDDGLTWTHVSDLQFWNNAVAQEYGVQAIPQNFLIDPKGRIVGRNLRGDDLEKKLSEIYQ